eukprot:3182419-Rhodomonas_salina.1
MYKSWSNGAQIPMDAEIELLSDAQLGSVLAHHGFVFKLPPDWAPADWLVKGDSFVMAQRCTGSKGTFYLDCNVLEPTEQVGQTLQLPISKPRLSKKQIEAGLRETYRWSVRGSLLDTLFHEPTTLSDAGLTQTTVQQVNQTILNLWC